MRINESTYVDKAEKVIINLAEESKKKNRGKVNIVTTSKIRNLLAMTADIYNQVVTSSKETLSEELNGRVEYLRVRFMYECGREPKVREFVQKAEILEILKEIKQSKKNYLLFSKYMEALIAFHRYYGGEDE
ncbi:CRISPR type III-A/MTUBE-associated protein Csm2 [uncultured Clostridium sp.]|nr:CRISPR type III-A/MTUBE-associated protein Csm2 [uncultured Clostridium sp.]